MVSPLPPIDTLEQRIALAAANRRVLAERLGWPAGYLEACEQVDADHPGWHATWHRANPGPPAFAHPAEFTAFLRAEHGAVATVHGETVEALLEAMALAERHVVWEQGRREAAFWSIGQT